MPKREMAAGKYLAEMQEVLQVFFPLFSSFLAHRVEIALIRSLSFYHDIIYFNCFQSK